MAPVSLTCIKCKETFKDRPSQRAHYGSEWHRLNITRLQKGLPVIDEENHKELVQKQTYLQQGQQVNYILECLPCKKRFASDASRQTHLRSKKHRDGLLQDKIAKIKERKMQKRMLAEYDEDNKGESDDESEQTTAQTCDVCPGKNGKIAVFVCIKDYTKHVATKSHKERVLAHKVEHRRRGVLDKLDEDLATKPKAITMEMDSENMEGVEAIEGEGNDDDFEDMEDDENENEVESNDNGEEDDTVPIPPTRCIFCGKSSSCMEDNIGHMERQHLFKIPHRRAANMEKLLNYIGHKVGVEHNCLDCSRPFTTRKAVRNHMVMRPHHEIRFEGEYDAFFDIAMILDDLADLPIRAGAKDLMFLPLSDGTLLTHRDLKSYFKQRLSEKRTLKRLAGAVGSKAIGHVGKAADLSKSLKEQRKQQKVQLKSKHILTRLHNRKEVNRQMKANKLQPHLRPQVINAG